MSAPVPTCAPLSIVAGDTVAWSRSFADYPASAGWSLHYKLVGPSASYSVDATASGDAFAVTIPAATSVNYAPGNYSLQEYVSNDAGDRYTTGITPLAIAANLAAAPSAGMDTRSDAQQMLDSVNAVLKGRAGEAEQQVTINGRSIVYMPVADLLALRSRLLLQVQNERRSQGLPDASTLRVRFCA